MWEKFSVFHSRLTQPLSQKVLKLYPINHYWDIFKGRAASTGSRRKSSRTTFNRETFNYSFISADIGQVWKWKCSLFKRCLQSPMNLLNAYLKSQKPPQMSVKTFFDDYSRLSFKLFSNAIRQTVHKNAPPMWDWSNKICRALILRRSNKVMINGSWQFVLKKQQIKIETLSEPLNVFVKVSLVLNVCQKTDADVFSFFHQKSSWTVSEFVSKCRLDWQPKTLEILVSYRRQMKQLCLWQIWIYWKSTTQNKNTENKSCFSKLLAVCRKTLTSWWHKQETKTADQKFAANFFMPAWRNDPNRVGLFKPFCILTSAQESLQFVWFLLLFCFFCVYFLVFHSIPSDFYSLSNKWRQ